MSSSPFTYLFTEEIYQPAGGVVIVLAKKLDGYSAEDKTTLSKMLIALKLNAAAVQITSSAALTLESLSIYSPSHVLIFGSEIEGMKSYEAVQAHGFTVVKADDLSQLDDARKKSLWGVLRPIFGV